MMRACVSRADHDPDPDELERLGQQNLAPWTHPPVECSSERSDAAQRCGAGIPEDDGVVETHRLASAGELPEIDPRIGETHDGEAVPRHHRSRVQRSMSDDIGAAQVRQVDGSDDVQALVFLQRIGQRKTVE